jgi:aspartate-semialdehyde dehydrogenase
MSIFLPKPHKLTQPIPVAIVGATGVVGQRLLVLCQQTPWITVVQVASSSKRNGLFFGDTCPWRDTSPMPEAMRRVTCCTMDEVSAPYILSCLPSDIAQEWEPKWATRGQHVFSNASTFRMDQNVPLLVPEINADHIQLIKNQTTQGKIITNPNCSATGIALALAPIMEQSALDHASIVTMQSVSGAGYPGISSLDILGNTIPDIPGEAPKIAQELKKILGTAHTAAHFNATVTVHRVPVLYGHVATLHIMLQQPLSGAQITELYNQWNVRLGYDLFVCHTSADRPQAQKDLTMNDMRIHIGPIGQGGKPHIVQVTILSHNLVRGAAGAVLSNLACYLAH